MRSFPKEFLYRGFKIRRTSFNWRVVGEGLNDIVETYQDGKDLIDRTIADANEKAPRKPNALDADLSEVLK